MKKLDYIQIDEKDIKVLRELKLTDFVSTEEILISISARI